jgi:calcium-dependent protein kinase
MVRNKITKKIRAERVIKKELIEIKEEENLFLKELALLRTMDHPNIIKIYEFFREDKFYYLLSE